MSRINLGSVVNTIHHGCGCIKRVYDTGAHRTDTCPEHEMRLAFESIGRGYRMSAQKFEAAAAEIAEAIKGIRRRPESAPWLVRELRLWRRWVRGIVAARRYGRDRKSESGGAE